MGARARSGARALITHQRPGHATYYAEPTAMFGLRMLFTMPDLPDVYRYDLFDYRSTHTIV